MDANFRTLKVGDIVMVTSDIGFCSGGEETVTKITTEHIAGKVEGKIIKTSKTRKVAWFGRQGFDMNTGEPVTEPWAYYMGWIVERVKK